MSPPIEASSSDEGQVASEQAIVCGVQLPGRSPALWAGSVTQAAGKPGALLRDAEDPRLVELAQRSSELRLPDSEHFGNISDTESAWAGGPDAEAGPVVIDAAFLDTFVDQMEELRSSVTAEELYANLMDQDQQLRRLQAWLDTLTG